MSDQPLRIFIGLPCGEFSRYAAHWLSRGGLNCEGIEVQSAQVHGLYIDQNQNMLVREMIKLEEVYGRRFDYFWLLNDDMIIPPYTLKELISWKKDIIVPLLVKHDMPFEPLFYDYREPDGQYHHMFLEPFMRGCVQGVGSGGGGMLIKREVFDAMTDPWWETHWTDTKPPVRSTEDLDFCEKAINAGFTIWCDLDAPVGHLTTFTNWPLRLPDGTWATGIERHGMHTIVPAALDPVKNEQMLPEDAYLNTNTPFVDVVR
jgi:hypothetical protein